MAVDNLVGTADVAKVQSIDFANQFGNGISKLLEAMGVVRKIPLAEGMIIKTYKSVNDINTSAVGEGELIPLSEVSRVIDKTEELVLDKKRKAVSGEAIQRSGVANAVTETDNILLKELQKLIKVSLFTFLAGGTGSSYGVGLQQTMAKAWGQVQTLFEDDGAAVVVFVNPLDAADYIGSANITTQTAFGMTFISGFAGVSIVVSGNVPVGKLYATAVENLVYAYVPMQNSTLANTFNLTTDETGYIGVVHTNATNSLTVETLAVSGSKLFAERTDGLVELDIVTSAVDTAIKAAIVLVEEAEESDLTADKTAAQTAVTNLPAVNIKAVLQARVTAIVAS